LSLGWFGSADAKEDVTFANFIPSSLLTKDEIAPP